MFDIRQARIDELPAIERLMTLCPGAYRNVRDGRAQFFVAISDLGIIGCTGLEKVGDRYGLVRPLVVMPGFRKQHIGRHLFQRLLVHAEEAGIEHIYLLTEGARDYFSHLGFSPCARDSAPPALQATPHFQRASSQEASLMHRPLHADDSSEFLAGAVARTAKFHFDSGYFCAESVLLAVSDHLGVASPLLPAIATGFSHGVARTWGTCGAVSGAIMGISVATGRRNPHDSHDDTHHGVRTLIQQFTEHCGSTHCSELLACDLDTRDGQRIYQENHLRAQCREYVGTAARLAASIIRQSDAVPASVPAIGKAA